jgi:hypothetical protein
MYLGAQTLHSSNRIQLEFQLERKVRNQQSQQSDTHSGNTNMCAKRKYLFSKRKRKLNLKKKK